MRPPLLSGTFAAITGAITLFGCGGGGGGTSTPTAPSPSTPAAAIITVAVVSSIGNTAYQPNPVRAGVGDTVLFRNNDGATHRIVMDDGSSDLGEIAPGASSRTLTIRSGTALTFRCTIHPSMVGSINGATAPEPPPCRDDYGMAC